MAGLDRLVGRQKLSFLPVIFPCVYYFTMSSKEHQYPLGYIGEQPTLNEVHAESVGTVFGSAELGAIYNTYGLVGLYAALDEADTTQLERLYTAPVEGEDPTQFAKCYARIHEVKQDSKGDPAERERLSATVDALPRQVQKFYAAIEARLNDPAEGVIGLKQAVNKRMDEFATYLPHGDFDIVIPPMGQTGLFGRATHGSGRLVCPIGEEILPNGDRQVTSFLLADTPPKQYPTLIAVSSNCERGFDPKTAIPKLTFCSILDRPDVRSQSVLGPEVVYSPLTPRKAYRGPAGPRVGLVKAA